MNWNPRIIQPRMSKLLVTNFETRGKVSKGQAMPIFIFESYGELFAKQNSEEFRRGSSQKRIVFSNLMQNFFENVRKIYFGLHHSKEETFLSRMI